MTPTKRTTSSTTSSSSISSNRTHLLILIITLLLLIPSTLQCGPGRGAGRRRGNRKMTPLVFKQHVPNVAENTLMASGLEEGRITRDSPEFKNLVTNLNPEILFKDEEGTGADRMMSQRCKDKLTTLSISVMNQWTGVRLRVTEAWDEDSHHAVNSLHYEGRAVDITTSDRDRSKYGTLARLAYEAGFDWVYYESRGHIHCSVKSDNSIAVETGGCFPSAGTVTLEDGRSKTMDQLSLGDRVLSMDSSMNPIFSEVIMFFHRSRNHNTTYYSIALDNGKRLSITGSHLVYASKSGKLEDAVIMYAGKVEVGMYMFTSSEVGGANAANSKVGGDMQMSGGNQNQMSASTTKMEARKVVGIQGSTQRGIYAPLTKHGTIVVDNVLVSCYAWMESQTIAHASLLPFRLYHEARSKLSGLFGFSGENRDSVINVVNNNNRSITTSQQDNGVEDYGDHGVHWYPRLLHTLAPYVLPEHMLFSRL